MSPIKIEKGVPAPARAGAPSVTTSKVREALEALKGAEIEDSVLLANEDLPDLARATVIVGRQAYRLGGGGWITCRRVNRGVRIWKVGEPGEGKR